MSAIQYTSEGLYTKEYCEMKTRESFAKTAVLRQEYIANKLIIANKVTGQIRKAQQRNKLICAEIKAIEYGRDKYNNGGIC